MKIEMRVDEQPLELSGVTIEALKEKIQSHYSWALSYDFSQKKKVIIGSGMYLS